MPVSYEEYYSMFIDYIKKQENITRNKLKNINQNSKLRKVFKDLQSKNCFKFIEYYEVLSSVSSTIKENLDIIDFLVKNNITDAPQMNDAMESILNDNTLLRIVGNTESKEMLEGMLQKYAIILDGTCDFEILKNALLSSNLSTECIIGILTHEAEKSTKDEKKALPSLEEYENNEIIQRYQAVIKKVNELIDKYYHVIEGKPSNLIDMYKRTISVTNMDGVDEIYQEKDVLLCMHLLHLMNIKAEGEEILNDRPIDFTLVEVNIEELNEAYERTAASVINYEKEKQESMPQEASLYFLIDDYIPFFNLDEFTEEEYKNIGSVLVDLERGLFDYERKKSNHSIVKQNIRRDLNVFVNRKRNMAVSYIRVNSDKVLVIEVGDIRNIFTLTQSALRNCSDLIDMAISKIKANDSEFMAKQDVARDDIMAILQSEEVTLHE